MAITVKVSQGRKRGKSARLRASLKKKEQGRKSRWYK